MDIIPSKRFVGTNLIFPPFSSSKPVLILKSHSVKGFLSILDISKKGISLSVLKRRFSIAILSLFLNGKAL